MITIIHKIRQSIASPIERKPRLITPDMLVMWLGIFVLAATTVYWSYLGALIHQYNADQLANTFLFETSNVFYGTSWPDQHTFLLKWPLFWITQLFGATPSVFVGATIGVSLATVLSFAYLLYRINRRPLQVGLLYLAMALVLLLTPAQPYPGALLPVNMAMLTTRNLEYIVFIIAILMLIKARYWVNWRMLTSFLLMTLLIASDKLFLAISVAGAVGGIAIYSLLRRWQMAKLFARWLFISVTAGVAALGIIWALDSFTAVHIASTGTVAGPYGVTFGPKELLLGLIYFIFAWLSNMGANPASDTRLLDNFMREVSTGLAGAGGIGFVITLILAVLSLFAFVYVLRVSFKKHVKQNEPDASVPSISVTLAAMLMASVGAAAAAFIFSHHYFPVDARYVAIIFFASFVVLAVTIRLRPVSPVVSTLATMALLVGIIGAMTTATTQFSQQELAMRDITDRNNRIVQALAHHKSDVLVGDYWRVLPIKLAASQQLLAMPLATCVEPRDVLSSKAWQPDLTKQRFAYILTLQASNTGFPSCHLPEVIKHLGVPNASTVIKGTVDDPEELLLFYDSVDGKKSGASKPVSYPEKAAPSTVLPASIETLDARCSTSTIMNIVAHEDDDLLFLSPDLIHSIKAGQCVRTIFVTAGSAGSDSQYWSGREKGSIAAYTRMLGLNSATVWIERLAILPGGQFVTIANPKGNPSISLLFMRLPDGNLTGQGFASTRHESLERLEAGHISTITSVDEQSRYSSAQLHEALMAIVKKYQPAEIRTQADDTAAHIADHSDHKSVARFVTGVYEEYSKTYNASLSYYHGYPVREQPENVLGDDLLQKQAAFFEYAHFDAAVCGSSEACQNGTVYDGYLKRQYK